MQKYKHPITGEPIGLGKHISWKIQFAIRRWSFILTITAVTLVCVAWGLHDNGVIAWWNVWASYMALFIESVVGIAMFEQTQSDAKVIRRILAMEDHQFAELKQLIAKVEEDLETYHEDEHE
jgi:hypothetical protein